jgi:hypothetical protein
MNKYAVILMTSAALTLGGLAPASAEMTTDESMNATVETRAVQPKLSGKALQRARAMQAHAEVRAPARQGVAPEAAFAGVGVLALVLLLAL